MTKLEFALKNFEAGTKLIVIEEKISTFHVVKVLMDFKKHHFSLFSFGCCNKTPKEKEYVFFDAKYVTEKNSGFDFYLVEEIY